MTTGLGHERSEKVGTRSVSSSSREIVKEGNLVLLHGVQICRANSKRIFPPSVDLT